MLTIYKDLGLHLSDGVAANWLMLLYIKVFYGI